LQHSGRHGIAQIVDGIQQREPNKIAEYHRQVGKMYSCIEFWPSVSPAEKQWYVRLNAIVGTSKTADTVSFLPRLL
jgi:hypothetical protein